MNDSILVLVGSDLLCINAPVMKLAPTSGDNEKLSGGIKKNTKQNTKQKTNKRVYKTQNNLFSQHHFLQMLQIILVK